MADGKGTSVGEPGQSVEADFRQFVAARSASLQRTAYLLVGDWPHAEDLLLGTTTDKWPVQASYSAVWDEGSGSFVVATQSEVLRIYIKDGRPYDSVPLPPSGLVGGVVMPIADLR